MSQSDISSKKKLINLSMERLNQELSRDDSLLRMIPVEEEEQLQSSPIKSRSSSKSLRQTATKPASDRRQERLSSNRQQSSTRRVEKSSPVRKSTSPAAKSAFTDRSSASPMKNTSPGKALSLRTNPKSTQRSRPTSSPVSSPPSKLRTVYKTPDAAKSKNYIALRSPTPQDTQSRRQSNAYESPVREYTVVNPSNSLISNDIEHSQNYSANRGHISFSADPEPEQLIPHEQILPHQPTLQDSVAYSITREVAEEQPALDIEDLLDKTVNALNVKTFLVTVCSACQSDKPLRLSETS